MGPTIFDSPTAFWWLAFTKVGPSKIVLNKSQLGGHHQNFTVFILKKVRWSASEINFFYVQYSWTSGLFDKKERNFVPNKNLEGYIVSSDWRSGRFVQFAYAQSKRRLYLCFSILLSRASPYISCVDWKQCLVRIYGLLIQREVNMTEY